MYNVIYTRYRHSMVIDSMRRKASEQDYFQTMNLLGCFVRGMLHPNILSICLAHEHTKIIYNIKKKSSNRAAKNRKNLYRERDSDLSGCGKKDQRQI